MVRLALNVDKLTVAEFIEFCRTIVTAMTGNTNFATPTPTLADVTTAIDTLEATYQLGLTGNHIAKGLQTGQRDFLNSLMMQLKSYVETTSGEDEEVARTSGIRPRKSPERISSIDAPANVLAVPGSDPGTGRITWDAVRNRTKYLVYSTTDMADVKNQSKWTLVGNTGQLSFDATGLTSATNYAFFVVALGTRDLRSEGSDPAIMMAA